MKGQARPPVWVMGLSGASFGLVGGFPLFALAQASWPATYRRLANIAGFGVMAVLGGELIRGALPTVAAVSTFAVDAALGLIACVVMTIVLLYLERPRLGRPAVTYMTPVGRNGLLSGPRAARSCFSLAEPDYLSTVSMVLRRKSSGPTAVDRCNAESLVKTGPADAYRAYL